VSTGKYIGLSSSSGHSPASETYFGMTVGSINSDWQLTIFGTSTNSKGYSSFVVLDDSSFVSLWCPYFSSPLCALGRTNYSTGVSISLSSINYFGSGDYIWGF